MSRDPSPVTLSDDDRRRLGLWAADCAERVLPLFEAQAPSDIRPREAIDGIRAFARGDLRKGALRPLVFAALAAAREVVDPAAAAAARAASCAASSVFLHARATPNQEKHVLGAAMYAARARELAAGEDASVGDGEVREMIELAPPAVRQLMRQLPPRRLGRSRLDALLHQLDAGLRR